LPKLEEDDNLSTVYTLRFGGGQISASNFGVITTTISIYATGRGTPRELQLSLKMVF